MRSALRFALVALTLAAIAAPPAAHAAVLDPVEVFSDAVGDGPIGGGVDAYQDLVAGTIAENDLNIIMTFVVDDIPDVLTHGVPDIAAYYWDFSIDDSASGKGSHGYELVVNPSLNPNTNPSASLTHNCTLTGNLWSCDTVPASKATVTIDSILDTISVTITRKSFKDDAGKVIAEDGAVLQQEVYYAGIGAFTTTPVLSSGATQDDATMDDVYILGTPR